MLEERAAKCGILSEFFDATGTLRTASDQNIAHLVDAIEAGNKNKSDLDRALLVSFDEPYDSVTVRLPFEPVGKNECRVLLENGDKIKGLIHHAGGAFHLTISLPFGYHTLVFDNAETKRLPLIATPKRCWFPEVSRKYWGVSLQLFLIRSTDNWGIGDFADLTKIIQLFGPLGCDVIGLNPLHQLDIETPSAASPYSPLSRNFLNVLYISVPSVPGFSESDEVRSLLNTPQFNNLLERARSSQQVDYEAVAALKMPVLESLFRHFDTMPSDLRRRFKNFKHAMGIDLHLNSTFHALRRHLTKVQGATHDWHEWPEEYKSPHSHSALAFAEQNPHAVDFYSWLQWLAEEQLSTAYQAACQHHMQFRLYRDLAVGVDKNGADTWANPSAYLAQTSVGCPPDVFNLRGQDWGFPPPNPRRMQLDAYREFARTVAANMRHAGGLRIDHVMGLLRLYSIPEGNKPVEGAYVQYPLTDLLGILALESYRNQCMVVGEDLGTVPDGFRERLSAAGVLSYRVIFFEQNWESHEFIAPHDYPDLSLGVGGSHDLPTLLGWWHGNDIKLKANLGLYTQSETSSHEVQRSAEKANFIRACQRLDIPLDEKSTDREIIDAVHVFLAQSSSVIVTIQLDDLMGESRTGQFARNISPICKLAKKIPSFN